MNKRIEMRNYLHAKMMRSTVAHTARFYGLADKTRLKHPYDQFSHFGAACVRVLLKHAKKGQLH